MSFEQLADLDSLLARIDAQQEQVCALKTEHPDAYSRLMESWAIESTYNSNNIEGSTLSLGDTALVYDGAQVDAPLADIQQAEGGFAALRFLNGELAAGSALSEKLVKRAHELVFAEAADPSVRGSYRTIEVEITGTTHTPTPAAYIEERMAGLLASCNKSKRHPVVIAALFHLEFESIHPFVNANGRTGRLFSNFILMSAGIEPVNIQAESRARYIGALRAFTEQDDPYPFVGFFALCVSERQQRIINMLSPSVDKALEPRESDIVKALADGDPPSTPQVPPKLTPQVERVLDALGASELSGRELMSALGLADRKHFRVSYLDPALEMGLVERTIPDKPNSKNQKYRKTH